MQGSIPQGDPDALMTKEHNFRARHRDGWPQPMRPLARGSPSSEMVSPVRLTCPASSMQYSLPSATSSVWSTMLAYLRSHEPTCSPPPPNRKHLSRLATVALDIAYSPRSA